jgi:hypothetical protein
LTHQKICTSSKKNTALLNQQPPNQTLQRTASGSALLRLQPPLWTGARLRRLAKYIIPLIRTRLILHLSATRARFSNEVLIGAYPRLFAGNSVLRHCFSESLAVD